MAAAMNNLTRKLPLWLSMLIGSLFVLLPLGSAAEYSLRQPVKQNHGFDNYQWFLELPDFGKYIGISFALSVVASLILLALLVPTVVWLNLKGEKLRPFVDFITLMPLVIPVVALAIGAQNSLPEFAQTNEFILSFLYAVLAMPYAYRTLDTGLKSIALKTIAEAARGLGASWPKTIFSVIAPVIRGTVLSALFMSLALSFGEYTITSLLHWDTFTTWVTVVSQQNVLGAIALSVFSLIAIFVFLLLVGLLVKPATSQVAKEED
jgi:putative spermidine/putrescine transport system permease protein